MPGERLEEFIEKTGMKKGDFAAALAVKASQLSRYLGRDGQMPQRDVLMRLAAMGCNLHWLITGEGRMFADNDAGVRLFNEVYALGKEHAPKLIRDPDNILSMRVIRSNDLEELEMLIAKMKNTDT
jgi:hypothetical protein